MSFLSRRHPHPEPAGPPQRASKTTPIAEAVARTHLTIEGQVMRMRSRPTNRQPALAVTVSDETGSATAEWTGRRELGGLTLGRRIAIEGVAVLVGDRLEFTNPAYTLLS
jgi:RecG-like helicase